MSIAEAIAELDAPGAWFVIEQAGRAEDRVDRHAANLVEFLCYVVDKESQRKPFLASEIIPVSAQVELVVAVLGTQRVCEH